MLRDWVWMKFKSFRKNILSSKHTFFQNNVKFGTALDKLLSNDTKMVIGNKDQQVEQKEWENPKNPEKPKDDRDQEQLKRQLDESKRQKENLTGDNETKQTKN